MDYEQDDLQVAFDLRETGDHRVNLARPLKKRYVREIFQSTRGIEIFCLVSILFVV